MALRPTEEQLRAVEAYRSGQDLKVVAVAGSGKTTTLRLMAEAAPGRRGLYLAFNRSVREEAARKFPRNVRPYTLHALAFRMAVARDEGYLAKFTAGKGHLPARAVAEALELRNPLLLHAVLGTLEAFLRSEAASPEPGMIPLAYRTLRAGTKAWPEEEAFILRGVEALWRRMTDPKDPFPLPHGAYVKLWALSEPDLSFAEALLVDEAQDLDPIFLRVLEAHRGRVQRVYVGDPRQQIYGWRGAVNAMDRLEAPEARLTWSFRFAEPLARFVRNLTALQDRPVEVWGKAPWATRVDAALPRPPFTVLCRTNAGVVGAVVATQEVPKILNRAKNGELERVVVVEYEDRLARFGLGYIRRFLEAFGVELVVLNGKESEEIHRELAEDLVAVVSSFAARIYGRRGGRRGGKVKDGGKEG